MKIRKIVSYLLLSALLTILLSACAVTPLPSATPELSPSPSLQPTPVPTPEPTPLPDTKPLIWEVKAKEGEGHIYLFGSIHVGGEGLYPLPDEIIEAYNSSDTLAVEFDTTEMLTNFVVQLAVTRKLMYPEGDDITKHLSPETYDLAVDFLKKNGQYSSAYDRYNIYFWSSLVDGISFTLSELDADAGIDSYFLAKAHEDGKEILEIESLGFQLDLLSGQPDLLQDHMLRSSILYMDVAIDNLRALFDAYRLGDEQELTSLLFSDSDEDGLGELPPEEAEELAKMIDSYMYDMLTARNIAMAEKAEDLLEEGRGVFYVVGAGHMVGEGGIVDLLDDAGYTVAQIIY